MKLLLKSHIFKLPIYKTPKSQKPQGVHISEVSHVIYPQADPISF